jgi:sterol desaturase/sphingolipid hydroxylase (fatty acid hydroxylase superfamily)
LENSDNSILLLVLTVAGAALMSFIALTCHRWSKRLAMQGRHFVPRFFLSILMMAALFTIPLVLGIFYSLFYGYRLQAGEASGPGGDPVVFVVLELWLFGAILLLVYLTAALLNRRVLS